MFELVDGASLLEGVDWLTAKEPAFARIVTRCGPPPLWPRTPGFASLVHIILEQQVSLASAKAAFDRLAEACPRMAPEDFLLLSAEELKRIGFSRQKAAYCRDLACELAEGRLNLEPLEEMDDDAVRSALVRLKGVGPWTAEIYLLLVLRRPDAWPIQDRALAVAYQRAFGLPGVPLPVVLEAAGQAWRPFRSIAARILWHDYLSSGAGGAVMEQSG